MNKILKKLWILQENKKKMPLGNTYTYRRVNPYNPLSYIFLILLSIISIFFIGIFGVVENWNKNMFKWN